MKIYISCDAEGASGIHRIPEEIPEYRTMMTRDVNAAVAGARAGGATEILVWDMHDSGKTLIYEELDAGAEYMMGAPYVERFPGLDASFAGVFLVGYHAMAGTPRAVCDHTMSSSMWQHIWVNGVMLGEVGLDALWAGRFGVPVLLVTGDDKVCAEARALLGDIETAQVKEGWGRHAARLLSPAVARQLIFEKARAAIAKAGRIKPFTMSPPYEVKLKYASTSHLDGILCDGKRRERLDGQTIVFRSDNLVEALSRQV
ncbi:MAG: M55 family metallopeptidase [Candidatus Sumerlaeia bacterium]|nr:M55 family metallopeptidase [Candidatus Sumerlaeia bacterium]